LTLKFCLSGSFFVLSRFRGKRFDDADDDEYEDDCS